MVPAAAPVSSPQPEAPSAAALAMAATFRAFDSELSDDELRRIAARIDENRMGAALNPKTRPLRNADEPVGRFAVAESA